MKKNSGRILWTAAIFLIGLLASPYLGSALLPTAKAQTQPGLSRGAGSAGVIIEQFAFRTLKGTTSTVRVQRDQLVIDPGYGNLVQITEVKGRTVLWYHNPQDGAVRNVIIENGLFPVKITTNQ